MYKLYILAAACVLSVSACNPINKKSCPGFDGAPLKFNDYTAGRQLVFTNGNSNIVFTVTSQDSTGPYTTECKGSRSDCQYTECMATGNLYATSDSSRNGFNMLVLSVQAQTFADLPPNGGRALFITLFDLKMPCRYDPIGATYVAADSILSPFTALGKTYDTVRVLTADTLQPGNTGKAIWRIYAVKDHIIGFSDRQTHTDFFLKE